MKLKSLVFILALVVLYLSQSLSLSAVDGEGWQYIPINCGGWTYWDPNSIISPVCYQLTSGVEYPPDTVVYIPDNDSHYIYVLYW